MVPLAALLLEEGHRVTGSDNTLYPPMSTTLQRLGIPVATGFAADHVPPDTEVVVVGNAALRDNVEAAEAVRRGLPVLSLPQAVREHLLPGKTSIVITGTHGKTTTSALTAWLLLDSGRDPGFLVGGEMKNLGRGYRRGAGPHFVLEGDEYNAAFFDRGPKFLHYEPKHLFVGNIDGGRFFVNDGKGRFTDGTNQMGVSDEVLEWTFSTVVPWTLASASARRRKMATARSLTSGVNSLPSMIFTM